MCFAIRRDGGVSQRYAGIANQAAPFRALDRAPAKHGAKIRLRKRSEPLEFGSEKRSFIFEYLARLKCSDARHRRLAVPGAHILADVAADNSIAHWSAKLVGNRSAEFDGEIGDAAARVEHIRRGERLRGAGIETARTSAAEIGGRRFARRERGFEGQRGDNDSEKQP